MRIAIVAEVFLPKVDGVVGRTLNLIRGLQARGDDVIVVCPAVPDPRTAPVPLVEFPSFSCRVYPDYHIGVPAGDLVQRLRDFRPDVLHFLNPFAFGFQCAQVLRKSCWNGPALWSFHTQYGEFVRSYPGLQPLSKILWWLMQRQHNTADCNLTVSSAMVNDLEARGFERVRLWPPAVDATRFHPSHATAAMRSRLSGRHPEFPLLLTASRLAPEKNTRFLSEILDRVPAARLGIVGDGPERPALERRFARHPAQFTGCLIGSELAEAYASADIFVYASETETMGNVILEAMASGLPVVAAGAGGVTSLVDHGVTGFLFRPGRADEAAGYVRQLLDNSQLRNTMAANALADAQSRTWQQAADCVRSEYMKVVETWQQRPLTLRSPGLPARICTSLLVAAFRSLARQRTNIPTRSGHYSAPESAVSANASAISRSRFADEVFHANNSPEISY
jgi:glycosyltransferase involved in cell wall biosynthesis